MDDLRTRFMKTGQPETHPAALAYMSGVQKEILEKHPEADVKVYAVWFSMLPGDSRSGWDDCVISDPRVHNPWDRKHLASQAFAGDIEGVAPPVWDAYLLYGPKSA